MVRCPFIAAASVAVTLILGSVALAQPAKPPATKPLPIAERLGKPTSFKYDKTPFKEVIEDLKELLSVPIVLEYKVLEEAGINLEFPVSGESGKGSALESVNGLFNPVGIAAEIRHNVLFVSTVPAHSKWLVGRTYRVKAGNNAEALAEKIKSQITLSSWDNSGGPASLENIGANVLVIYQTALHHREIEKKFTLELLQVAAPVERVDGLVPTKGTNPLARFREAFRRPTSAEYPETPFKEMVAHFGKVNKLEVVIDHKALADAAINEETPVTVNFQGLPLDAVLTLTMNDLGIAWTIDDDKILLTAPKAVRPITVVYDVRDLAPAADEKVLSAALMRTVQPAS